MLTGEDMNMWLLREIDELQREIDRMGSPREFADEIGSIREEANRIAGASFMDGPMPPLLFGMDTLKERIERLKMRMDSGDS